jgi:hypothetical protein
MVKKSTSRIFSNQSVQQVPPTYEELNAFMKPSLLSPKYEYPNLRVSPDSPDSPDSHKSYGDNTTDGNNSDSSNSSNRSNRSNRSNGSEGKCKVSYKTDGSYAGSTSSKDLKLYDMKCLLDKKRKAIYDKNREVKKLASNNPYLSSVVSDYDNIQGAILEEKKDQKTALKILSKHIRDISDHIKHDEFQLQRIREDQQILMDEIDKLRKDIGYIHNKISGDYAIKKKHKYPTWRYDDAASDDSVSSDYESSDGTYDERY